MLSAYEMWVVYAHFLQQQKAWNNPFFVTNTLTEPVFVVI